MRLTCLALGTLLLAAPAAAQSLAQDHAGRWNGGGVQPDGSTWAMALSLYADGAVVEYPDIPCAAYWAFSGFERRALNATEHLVAGFDACVDGLPLRATVDAKGTMTVSWSNPDGTYNASAWLHRSDD